MNIDRIYTIKESHIKNQGSYVLYWMQHSQRISYNHALDFAIKKANENNLPLLVFFAVSNTFSKANKRHYTFMLEGIKEVKKSLLSLGINFVLRVGNPPELVKEYLSQSETFVMDFGYLDIERKWRHEVINHINKHNLNLHVYMIESDLIIPVKKASDKVEYGAYTLRPKLHRYLPFFRDFTTLEVIKNSTKILFKSDHDLKDILCLVSRLDINLSISPSSFYKGGYSLALNTLNQFIKTKINDYPNSNDPSKNLTSHLSMYLHFGQISSLEIYETLLDAKNEGLILEDAFDAFVEQLFIRRELAYNFVYYQKNYDQFESITESWAYQTMQDHTYDQRAYVYTKDDYIHFKTHDPYFNAAMKQMVITGYMHNYMRMYWGKKIIEWSRTHKEAYEIMLDLNNTYFIDGHNPNGYTGVAWCFGKHDRPWGERPIFGKLRYMNSDGLKRKFDIESYVKDMNHL